MSRHPIWINDRGEILLVGEDDFDEDEGEQSFWSTRWPNGLIHHLRVGHYAVVISPELGFDWTTMRTKNELVVAVDYYDTTLIEDQAKDPLKDTGSLTSFGQGRVSIVGRVLSRLNSNHVEHAGLFKACLDEMNFWIKKFEAINKEKSS